MKKTVLTVMTAMALLCLAIATQAQNVPSYVPTNGLVGWWPFNGNANDESGNGNNGTVNGATLVNDRLGNAASAYNFNGVNDFIRCNSAGPTGVTSVSISIWLKTSQSSYAQIFGYGNEGVSGSAVRIQTNSGCSNGAIAFDTYDNVKRFNNSYSNLWENYCFVYDISAGNSVSVVKVYKDGQLVNSVCQTIVLSNNNFAATNPIAIGRYHGVAASQLPAYFQGEMDDIGIWNRALTQQEITNLYNASTPPPCNPLPVNLMSGLVGYWPFCGNANDESGNGNNCSVNNGPLLGNDRFGNSNSAYLFDGIDDWIQTNNAFLQTDLPHTISMWWLTTDSSKTNQTLFNTNPHTLENLAFHYSGSNPNPPYGIAYGLGNGNSGASSWNIMNPDNGQVAMNGGFNSWHHCVWVKDSTYRWQIYIDGIQGLNFTSALNTGSQTANLRFGAENNGVPTGGANFKGYIDDICVWNRALSPQEISQLYNQNICYQTITVTDTLLINVHLTGLNPITYQNTIKVFPNPAGDHVTIDFGTNYASLNGYTLRIDNTLGQTVFTSPVQQPSAYIDLNSWSGVGVYFVYLVDALGHTVDVRKIVLQ
jgi:hypothetical protein